MNQSGFDGKEYFSEQFSGLNISKKELSGLLFEGCEFSDCDFSEAVLKKCKFTECYFHNCNLSVINPGYSQFRNVEFDSCKLLGINWTRADWPKVSFFKLLSFQRCILNDSSFLGLALEEMVLQECRAHDVDFRGANLREANLSFTDFSRSLFNKTNLSYADFTESINYDIDIYNNDIKKAKFSRYEAVRLLDCLNIELIG